MFAVLVNKHEDTFRRRMENHEGADMSDTWSYVQNTIANRVLH